MSESAISVRNLSKCYRLGSISRHTLVEEVEHWWHKLCGRDPRREMGKIGPARAVARPMAMAEEEGKNEFWALKNVSFEIQRGEVVGIIGRNGAGKSTLLKILSRITEPTQGDAFINGRVGSLLEVGTGFHPELTGRENIYMNGAILGMKRFEIQRCFEKIVEFAEVSEFLDTPVKRYSSGMYVRLAFAVAAHLEPEILLVDEVLAVGDAGFQNKCLGKISEIAGQGRTVLFVSHNMGAIKSLCEKCILLDGGRLRMMERTDQVLDEYLLGEDRSHGCVQFAPSSYEAYFVEVAIASRDGRVSNSYGADEDVVLRLKYFVTQDIPGLEVYFHLNDRNGALLFHSSHKANENICSTMHKAGMYLSEVTIPGHFLAPGRFLVTLGMQRQNIQRLDCRENAMSLVVTNSGLPDYMVPHHASMGCIAVAFPWTVAKIS